MTEPKETAGAGEQLATTRGEAEGRRQALRRLGRFAAVTAPTVTLLLAAKSKPASAATSPPQNSSRQLKITEGAVDTAVMLAAVTSLGGTAATIDPIDGIGMCLAAIKGLNDRIMGLELQTAAL